MLLEPTEDLSGWRSSQVHLDSEEGSEEAENERRPNYRWKRGDVVRM